MAMSLLEVFPRRVAMLVVFPQRLAQPGVEVRLVVLAVAAVVGSSYWLPWRLCCCSHCCCVAV